MRRLLLTVAVILATLSTVSVALVESGPPEIPWHTIDGGGTTASYGGDFALSGTMGQPDAGRSWGGVYVVRGGFWGVHPASLSPLGEYQVYLPLIRR